MAGEWIPMRMDLPDDPAVISIAGALGLDEFAVVGRLHRLWCWASRHLTDGNATGVTLQWVDRYLSTPGFAAAMLAAGWLRDRSGGVEFPNFERWNSQSAKRRALTAKRVAAHRGQADAKSNAPTVTEALPEKRREEKKKTKTPPPPPRRGEEERPNPTAPLAVVPGPRAAKPRDELFDAVAEVTGLDPATAGRLLGTVTAELRKLDPPFEPAEVRAFAGRFWELCTWAARDQRERPTPNEVAKYGPQVRASPAPPQRQPANGRSLFKTRGEAEVDHFTATVMDTYAKRGMT